MFNAQPTITVIFKATAVSAVVVTMIILTMIILMMMMMMMMMLMMMMMMMMMMMTTLKLVVQRARVDNDTIYTHVYIQKQKLKTATRTP